MSALVRPRFAHVNGRLVPFAEASVPITDRGFLFADSIYEVTAVLDSAFLDLDGHMARLDRSLREIDIPNPHDAATWTRLMADLARANGLVEGLVYMQVTRGSQDRDFVPPPDLVPNVVMFTQEKALRVTAAASKGVSVITLPDLRWARRDIKSTGLLAQVLAKRAAKAAGAQEAWMVEEGGVVTEGASWTAFIVTPQGELVTRPLSHAVLPGITRDTMMRIAVKHGLRLVERTFTVAEALKAREVFLTSAGTILSPIVAIDGTPVANGHPGQVARDLRAAYLEDAARTPIGA
jgi:D-alanine transaminase